MTKETIICGTLDELTAYFAAEFPVASLHPAEGFPTYTEQLQRIMETDVKTGAVFLLKSDLDLAKAAQSESPPEVTITLVKTWVHIRWRGYEWTTDIHNQNNATSKRRGRRMRDDE